MENKFSSFFVATGSNLAERKYNLETASLKLQVSFELIASSRIYESPAVDYLNQPDFYNQVLEFKIHPMGPISAMEELLKIENIIGRERHIPKGPRIIDLDLLFWGLDKINTQNLEIPHPRLFERSFVVLPLSELPGFNTLNHHFAFNFDFSNSATAKIFS